MEATYVIIGLIVFALFIAWAAKVVREGDQKAVPATPSKPLKEAIPLKPVMAVRKAPARGATRRKTK